MGLAVQRRVLVSERSCVTYGGGVADGDEQVVDLLRVVIHRCVVHHLRIEQLLNVGLSGVVGATDWPLDLGQVILLLLHLLDLHLLDVLSYLLSEQIPQLVPDLVPRIELLGQLIRVVTLADQDVLAASLTNLNRQREDFPPFTGGSRRPCRRTLLVLPLLVDYMLILLPVLEVVQVAWQSERLKESLFKLAVM